MSSAPEPVLCLSKYVKKSSQLHLPAAAQAGAPTGRVTWIAQMDFYELEGKVLRNGNLFYSASVPLWQNAVGFFYRCLMERK